MIFLSFPGGPNVKKIFEYTNTLFQGMDNFYGFSNFIYTIDDMSELSVQGKNKFSLH